MKSYINLIVTLLIAIKINYLSCHNVTSGNFTLIYDPSVGEEDKWYINDHTFIKDNNGLWHLFGITHMEPVGTGEEILFAHATAPHLLGPWTKQPFALKVDPKYFGEVHLWAPHVIYVNETYYMFYSGGDVDASKYAINLATSKDLFNWTRIPSGPIFRDGWAARDPMVIKIDNVWHLFYCSTETEKGGNNTVNYRTSNDLINWSERHITYDDPMAQSFSPTESPFIVHENDWWYLFTGPRLVYRRTSVFRSKTPTHFAYNDLIGEIHSHAAEVIYDDGKYWISHCGWGMGGVYLAELYF